MNIFRFGRAKERAGTEAAAQGIPHQMNLQTIPRTVEEYKGRPVISMTQDRSEEWLTQKIAQGKQEAFAEVVTLTPMLANALLARNPANRPLSKLNLERVTADIEGGRFEFNGESVVVSDDGFLNDGQHRCLAVQESGRSVRTTITFGVPRSSRFTIDTGNARTVGNFLGMQGHEDSNAIATVSLYVWLYRASNGLIASKGPAGRSSTLAKWRRPSKAEIFATANGFPDIAANLALTKNGVPGGRTLTAFCRWAIAKKAGDAAAAVFFESLYSGAGLKNDSPILYVRERLAGMPRNATAHERAMLIFRAWNIYRRGGSVTGGKGSFLTARGDAFPPLES